MFHISFSRYFKVLRRRSMVTAIHCHTPDSTIETHLIFSQRSWHYISALDASLTWNVLSDKYLLCQNSAQVSSSLSTHHVTLHPLILLNLSFTHVKRVSVRSSACNTSLSLLPMCLSCPDSSNYQGRGSLLFCCSVLSSV